MEQRTFDQCTEAELASLFELRYEEEYPKLAEWASQPHPIPVNYREIVEQLRRSLQRERNYWNEMELRTEFIGPLLTLVNFKGPDFKPFSLRSLSAVVEGVVLSGKPDWLVATGITEPVRPFFFIHEYKQLKVGSPDPMGQVLAAMLAAQTQNDDGQPVYGCYVVANAWYFVLLDGKTYAFSQGYDVMDKTELQTVWSILSETKLRIEKRAAEISAKK